MANRIASSISVNIPRELPSPRSLEPGSLITAKLLYGVQGHPGFVAPVPLSNSGPLKIDVDLTSELCIDTPSRLGKPRSYRIMLTSFRKPRNSQDHYATAVPIRPAGSSHNELSFLGRIQVLSIVESVSGTRDGEVTIYNPTALEDKQYFSQLDRTNLILLEDFLRRAV